MTPTLEYSYTPTLTLKPFSAHIAMALSAMPLSLIGFVALMTPLHVSNTRDLASSMRPEECEGNECALTKAV